METKKMGIIIMSVFSITRLKWEELENMTMAYLLVRTTKSGLSPEAIDIRQCLVPRYFTAMSS